MTLHPYTSLTAKDLDKFVVGFDKLWDRLAIVKEEATKHMMNYPPYNIKKIDENRYVIEMAIAGFGKQDVEIELADDKLIIRGNTSTKSDEHILYQGIANRAFTRQFTLADNVEIRHAELLNGLLKIWLESVIPEHKKPKKIEINEGPSSAPEFLTEQSKKMKGKS